MKYALILLLFLCSCASLTLPDGSRLEARGKAQAVVVVPRETKYDVVIIPFEGRVESELKESDIPGCPFLTRRYYDSDNDMINEEYIHTCQKAYFVKTDITVFDFLEFIVGAWLTAYGS